MLRLNQSWVKVGEIVFFDMIYMIFRIREVAERIMSLSEICKLVKDSRRTIAYISEP